MEYVISTERSFSEIELLTQGALERRGFSVQRTFSLQSATGMASEQEQPGYSVFLVRTSDAARRPLGLLTLYGRGAQTAINLVLSLVADADVAAELVAALVLDDLEMCIGAIGAERCIDLIGTEEELKPDDDQVSTTS